MLLAETERAMMKAADGDGGGRQPERRQSLVRLCDLGRSIRWSSTTGFRRLREKLPTGVELFVAGPADNG